MLCLFPASKSVPIWICLRNTVYTQLLICSLILIWIICCVFIIRIWFSTDFALVSAILELLYKENCPYTAFNLWSHLNLDYMLYFYCKNLDQYRFWSDVSHFEIALSVKLSMYSFLSEVQFEFGFDAVSVQIWCQPFWNRWLTLGKAI